MYCRKCGQELSDEDVFCPRCGNVVSEDAEGRQGEQRKTQTIKQKEVEKKYTKKGNAGKIAE